VSADAGRPDHRARGSKDVAVAMAARRSVVQDSNSVSPAVVRVVAVSNAAALLARHADLALIASVLRETGKIVNVIATGIGIDLPVHRVVVNSFGNALHVAAKVVVLNEIDSQVRRNVEAVTEIAKHAAQNGAARIEIASQVLPNVEVATEIVMPAVKNDADPIAIASPVLQDRPIGDG
jgi:hypothetical protein